MRRALLLAAGVAALAGAATAQHAGHGSQPAGTPGHATGRMSP